ncbi:MAG: choice-of-anchor J domain-containing protein [Anaerolineae bacterium]
MKRTMSLSMLIVAVILVTTLGVAADQGSRGKPLNGSASVPGTEIVILGSGITSSGQSFDDVTNLPGWAFVNNSSPLGLLDWFQGNGSVFPSHSGAASAYIAANYNNTSGGTISNWMMTPEMALVNGGTFSFWTRTETGSSYPDRLQVRLSTAGAGTDVGNGAEAVGSFSTLLLDINPGLAVGGYPEVWTQYTITLSGIPAGTTGRLAFRYYVTNGGPVEANSNYIGIDTVEYSMYDIFSKVYLPIVRK